jgi:hypothetical protein
MNRLKMGSQCERATKASLLNAILPSTRTTSGGYIHVTPSGDQRSRSELVV